MSFKNLQNQYLPINSQLLFADCCLKWLFFIFNPISVKRLLNFSYQLQTYQILSNLIDRTRTMESKLQEKTTQSEQLQKNENKQESPAAKPTRKYTKTQKSCQRWTEAENIAYAQYVVAEQQDFQDPQARVVKKVFKSLSKIVGTKTTDQCKSHHQKMLKHCGSIYGIGVKFLNFKPLEPEAEAQQFPFPPFNPPPLPLLKRQKQSELLVEGKIPSFEDYLKFASQFPMMSCFPSVKIEQVKAQENPIKTQF